MSKDLNTEVLSKETKSYVDIFEEKKAHFLDMFVQFQEDHQEELMALDTAREEANAALDEAKRAMREDSKEADYRKYKKINYGNFKVQKKWSSWYIVEMFIELIKQHELFDAAVDEGVITIKTEINAELATEFLRKNSLEDAFKVCIDGKELTPAVTCPKPIPAFGG